MYICKYVYMYICICISTVNATVSDFCLPSSREGWPCWGSFNSYHPLVNSEAMSHSINLIPYYAKKSQMDIHNIYIYIHIVYVALPSLHCSTIIIHFPCQVHGFRYISRLPSEQPQIHHLPSRPTIIYQLFVVILNSYIQKLTPHSDGFL